MEYKGNEQKEIEQNASKERAERAKERRKCAIERKQLEVAEKRQHLNVSGDRVVDICFTETITSTSTEEETGVANSTTGMSHQSPLVPLVVVQAKLKTKPKEASQSLQKTPKHRPRNSP